MATPMVLRRPRMRGLLIATLLTAVTGTSSVSAQSENAAPAPTPVEVPALELRLMAAALDTIISTHPDSAAVCVDIMADGNGSRPDVRLLMAEMKSPRHTTTVRDCPKTYASMIQYVDSLGRPVPDERPPGYVDPYYFHVGRPQFEHESVAWIYVRESHRTSGRALVCVAREENGRPRASCRAVDHWVS